MVGNELGAVRVGLLGCHWYDATRIKRTIGEVKLSWILPRCGVFSLQQARSKFYALTERLPDRRAWIAAFGG
jgi:hypothetical protein